MIYYDNSPNLFDEFSVLPFTVMDYALRRDLYLEDSIIKNYPDELIEFVPEMDLVDLEIRRFVCGLNQNLSRLYKAIETFLAVDEPVAQVLIPGILEAIRATLLLNEWYELMARFDWVRSQIQEKYNF